MSSIFLSHNHRDKPFVRRFAEDLTRYGHVVWVDEAEIHVGDSLIEKIQKSLHDVDFVAAVISRHSVDSTWVQRELDIASNRELAERRVIVLPLLLHKVEIPTFLTGKLFADFTDDSNYNNALECVLRAIAKHSGAAADFPDFKPPNMRAALATLYDSRCQICGYDSETPGEPCAIQPPTCGGRETLSNYLQLCHRHRQLFLEGMFSIADDCTFLGGVGMELELDPSHRLDSAALRYHQQNIYFLREIDPYTNPAAKPKA